MTNSGSALALPSAGEGLLADRRRKERDLVTSLPYIDNITPAEREVVKKLIEEEARPQTIPGSALTVLAVLLSTFMSPTCIWPLLW